MAYTTVTLLSYYNGSIIKNVDSVDYVGGSRFVLSVQSGISIFELKRMMYEATRWDSNMFDIEITWRMMMSQNPMRYATVMINCQITLNSMFAVAINSSATCVELYLTDVMIEGSSQIIMPQFLSQVSNPLRIIPESSRRHQDIDDSLMDGITANEDISMFDGAFANNDTDVSDDDADHDIQTDGQAPPPEFEDITWVDQAICSDLETARRKQTSGSGLQLGLLFETKEGLVNAVNMWHIKNSLEYRVHRSYPHYVTLKCAQAPQCEWYLRGALMENTGMFEISKLKESHTCSTSVLSDDHRQLTAKFIADMVLPIVHADLKLNIESIRATVKQQYGYNVSYFKAWKAKQQVLERLFGSHEEAFPMLPKLLNSLKESNPGTIVDWQFKSQVNDEAVFRGVFWAFGASIEGFRFCRPLISIDGTHLYGKYMGKLLVAVAFDANNGLYPLCYALVDEESTWSWSWFLHCIRTYVIRDRGPMCIISDRHAGIKNGMSKIFPEPYGHHRYCTRHLVSNFNHRFKSIMLKKRLSMMAREPSKRRFDSMYDDFSKVSEEVREWIEREPKERWTLAYDGGYRYGNMTTNISEVFNSVLKRGRALPVTALVQLTFYRCNKYFVSRRGQAHDFISRGIQWPPNVFAEIEAAKEKSKIHVVTLFNRDTMCFQVTTPRRQTRDGIRGEIRHKVILNERSCTCGKWTLLHRPCSHVVSCCAAYRLDYGNFVDPFYGLDMYSNSYAPLFHPLPDQSFLSEYTGPKVVADQARWRFRRGRPTST